MKYAQIAFAALLCAALYFTRSTNEKTVRVYRMKSDTIAKHRIPIVGENFNSEYIERTDSTYCIMHNF